MSEKQWFKVGLLVYHTNYIPGRIIEIDVASEDDVTLVVELERPLLSGNSVCKFRPSSLGSHLFLKPEDISIAEQKRFSNVRAHVETESKKGKRASIPLDLSASYDGRKLKPIEGQNEAYCLGEYHRYWCRQPREKRYNPNFDEYSARILNGPKNNKRGKDIDYFCNLLNNTIKEGATICVVPSSSVDNVDTGIRKIVKRVAGRGRLDATSCLKRVKSVKKMTRDINLHLSSIKVVDKHLIEGREIVLIDDVITTGSTMNACRELLLESGATRVYFVALGQTARE